jgi:hypothetical protein
VADEHVGTGPIGLIAPAWYLAPQRRQVAEAGWRLAALLHNVHGDGPVTGLEDPGRAVMLLQLSGEFAEPAAKERIWAAAEEHIEPTWDTERGEFTLGFGLNEPHPRGQLNARAMAGWTCGPGDWARLFNAPDLEKFDGPTVEGVDFPRVALSEARWDGEALHLAAQARNFRDSRTPATVTVSNVSDATGWAMFTAEGGKVSLPGADGRVEVTLPADNQPVVVRRTVI